MDPRRPARPSAAVGATAWVALLAFTDPGPVLRLVLLAPLVVVPLALARVATPTRDGTHHPTHRLAAVLQLPAALLLAASTLPSRGPLAAALALPWLGVAGLVALFGLWRLLPRGTRPVEELVVDFGLLYLPVGATALLLDRLGVSLLFSPLLVRLTAAHFHYATFLVPVAFGLLGRRFARQRRSYAALSVLAVASVPFLAAGITFSPALELVAAAAFAGSVGLLGALLAVAAPRVGDEDALAAAALVVAGVALVVTMGLALAYAVRQFFGVGPMTVSAMLATHAPMNVAGFAVPVLLALVRLDLPSRAPEPHVPLSPLTGGLRVGADYPRRRGLVGKPLDGQVEDVAVYAREPQPDADVAGFDPDDLAPAVGNFYESTVDYDLRYRARWHRPFRLATAAAMGVTRRIGQLALPTDDDLHGMRGEIRRIPAVDGRDHARFWTRTDGESGHTVFVAAYATHEHEGVTYMNIGMPLPGSNLSAVLRPETPGDGSLLLSSARDGNEAGLYLRTPLAPLRLPMHETFRVWPVDHANAPDPPDGAADVLGEVDLVATHEMWLLGAQFLTLTYGIGRDDG